MNISRLVNQFFRLVETASPRDYLIVAACAILLGFVCLKGFGSRDKY